MEIMTQQRMQGQVAIVTGAAQGIGRAVAQRYAAEGAHVVVNDVNVAGVDALVALITAAGGSALGVVADVSNKDQVDDLFARTVARFGTVDVLVNNAMITNGDRHFLQADEAWWRRVIDVNLTGPFLCSLAAAQIMARKKSGVIINFSSGGATRAHRGLAAYDASKGGIEALTRAMALDLAPYGIRVNALVPGSIDTTGMKSEIKQARGENIPMQRVGEAEELAGPAVFLASADASYITGHCLMVDGGMLAQQRSATVDIFPLSRFPVIGD
jgi:NAD(P)-dependent dehydrogenase (short-subunit alcohol dehydrogenase family)